ncbi:DHA1 family bicyclomycin/chloramphenicol resistance-like MFS transporter [Pontibacter ummariensis]|uniref:MFS transporter, DHA1 family, bicyclomycin/chloramphenicol resistance protein n=1 Tax=Pontibacter ummariensis TaxID=1610492 RepID=A0A239KJF3_9BACT|nr:multidrug effflux MFS transporter [Pontibacter ummariensis]PRY05691.1 DHA1 family bicyclomycin/chloramphenicol resistance-like MFS transporter [Pontibacter ummariensis]SNT18506.1 MFS transporter, DHA1 family, bicyclomycin/chloramphenicol resistance protein [Pontibacter ummariensis]
MTRKQYFIIVLILGALSTISPFAIDMYLPGFPAIAKDLNTTISQVQLSLTSYLIGISAGQLLYGPLLDRYGRKTPLYIGLVVYILASLGCAFVNSADSLIAMRFLQAVGGCAGMVAAQALVRDIFPVDKTAQAFSLLTLVIAVSPMIAPTLGGYVTAEFGWHAVFLILAGITVLIMLGVYVALPEGKQADPSISLKPKPVLGNFLIVLKQPQFLIYVLAGGIATAAPFAYIAGSSDVFINIYHVSEKEYGWIFAFLAFAMIGSTQLNHVLLKRFRSQQVVYATLLYQNVVGILLVVGVWQGWFGLYSLILLMFIFLTGQGLTNPNASALSLAPFTKHTGSAAALLGSFRMAMGGLASAVVSILHSGTALPMVSVMSLCTLTGLFILVVGKSTVRYRANKREVEEDTSVLL